MSKNITPYFSHDMNAFNDPKIIALVADHGMAAYGIFWAIVETLGQQEGYKISKAPYLMKAWASSFHVDKETLEAVISSMMEYGILESDDDHIWSPSLLKRM